MSATMGAFTFGEGYAVQFVAVLNFDNVKNVIVNFFFYLCGMFLR
jgi:hypothetical protein